MTADEEDEEEESYDTNIPFFDETQRNSTFSAPSHETLSRQRTRNVSQVSQVDKQSTQTVKFVCSDLCTVP